LRNLFAVLRYIPDNAAGPSMFNYDEAVREILSAEQNFLNSMELLLHVSKHWETALELARIVACTFL
jgi:hypothetical protein